ncbi:MAG TPA: hypothetical protein VFH92_09995 [Phenylobacterium sp.]|nr:hypothetical protein [Phenylobacterium sp.]
MSLRIPGLALGLAAALLPVMAFAQEVAGDWIGKVTVPTGDQLTVTFHFEAAADGAWQGYAGSPDQATTTLPVSEIKAAGDTLSFATPAVGATYAGKWDPAAKAWVGTLTQRATPMPLTLTHGLPPPRPVVAGLDGHWAGVLETPQGDLHLLLDVTTDAKGTLALFQSPDQTSARMVATLTHQGDAVTVELKGVGLFSAKLSPDGSTLDGSWKQGGGSLPLQLKKAG